MPPPRGDSRAMAAACCAAAAAAEAAAAPPAVVRGRFAAGGADGADGSGPAPSSQPGGRKEEISMPSDAIMSSSQASCSQGLRPKRPSLGLGGWVGGLGEGTRAEVV